MKKIIVLILALTSGMISCETDRVDNTDSSDSIIIGKFINSHEYKELVLNNTLVQRIGHVDLNRTVVEYFSFNDHNYSVINLALINRGNLVGEIVAISIPEDARKPVTGHSYLLVLRDLSVFDFKNKTGLVYDYDLNFDSYLAGIISVENNYIKSLDYYEMPDVIAKKYSFRKTYYTDSKIICDADNNADVSFGECYKCFKDAIRSNGSLEFLCDAADVVVFSCSGSVAISCAIISLNY